MLKRFLIGTLAFSSLAFAQPPVHRAVPLPPPPGAARGPVLHDARRDAGQAAHLLRAFDAAVARRDLRAISEVDRQFSRHLEQELRETRRDTRNDRSARATLARLNQLEKKLERLQGRFDRRSLDARRDRYAELVGLAGRELRSGRRF